MTGTMTIDETGDRETVDMGQLGSTYEICAALNFSRQRWYQIIETDDTAPDVVLRLANGKIVLWDMDDVKAWAERRGRTFHDDYLKRVPPNRTRKP